MKQLFFSIIIILLLPVQADAQCYPDRHSTNWFDGWVSCETRENPNRDRGEGHWIMYDYGAAYVLHQMQIWNSNDPANLDRGLQEVIIDYSADGIIWATAGTFQLPQATGSNTYEGFEGPDLQGVEAQYLLITGLSNWGGACYGLGEVHIEAEEVIVSSSNDLAENACFTAVILPNPFTETAVLRFDNACEGLLHYAIHDLLGNTVLVRERWMKTGVESIPLPLAGLPSGNYILNVRMGDVTHQIKLVKLTR